MASVDQIASLLKAHKKDEKSAPPLMNVQAVKGELLKHLADLKLPAGSTAKSWDELIQVFPAQPSDEQETSGVRVRLALRLSTTENTYLMTLMECLERDSRGVYLISVHVNWRLPERQIQKQVEESYQGHFNDVLRARHTLWAQTFRPRDLPEALDCCLKAILSHELVAGHTLDSESISRPPAAAARFPKPTDD